MNTARFNAVVIRRTEQINSVLANKAKEYAQEDRLHNFKVAARVNNTTPERALWGMLSKHLVSVMDMVEEKLDPTEYLINEKIGDLINYLILLEAIMIEGLEAKDTLPSPTQ